MIRTVKFGKIAIVIFLTILIWVWTDLDLDEVLPVPRATISVAQNAELLVSFNGQPEAVINTIKLKGPAKKISEVSRALENGTRDLDFTLNPERENMITTGSHILKVLDFLRKSDAIKELGGLTAESCEPESIDVDVVKLVIKSLEIECRDENGVLLNVESIVPDKVEMYVPEDSRLKAQVRLSSGNINQAKLSETTLYPYIELAGQRRNATTKVVIKIPPEADSLREYQISASLGIQSSMNLIGEYKLVIDNYNDLVSFFIFATPEAKDAYESEKFQITLNILDDDVKQPSDKEQRRDVVYNFPEEYVRKNEIRLKNDPGEAKFKLIPLKLAGAPTSGPN